MDGLREALELIIGMDVPHFTMDDLGRQYADKKMYRVQEDGEAKALKLSTLDSLLAYLLRKGDNHEGTLYVHVENPSLVRLVDTVCRKDDYRRNNFVTVTADIPSFPFGEFMPAEEFVIKVKSMFEEDSQSVPFPVEGRHGRDDLLMYAGNVQNGTVQTCVDDGVTQHATIKTGIINANDLVAPSIVMLKPFRTFLEVEQPESEFLFRMKESRDGTVMCALFEADGFMWKNHAKKAVAEYLGAKLADREDIIILF